MVEKLVIEGAQRKQVRKSFSQVEDKFIELRPNTEAYRNSFYCRTIKEWNSFPSSVLDIVKSPLFKKAVLRHK